MQETTSAIKITSQAQGGDGWLMASALAAWKFKNTTDPLPKRMWAWIFTPGTKGMWINLQSLWCASKELYKSLEDGFQASHFLGFKPWASVPALSYVFLHLAQTSTTVEGSRFLLRLELHTIYMRVTPQSAAPSKEQQIFPQWEVVVWGRISSKRKWLSRSMGLDLNGIFSPGSGETILPLRKG